MTEHVDDDGAASCDAMALLRFVYNNCPLRIENQRLQKREETHCDEPLGGFYVERTCSMF